MYKNGYPCLIRIEITVTYIFINCDQGFCGTTFADSLKRLNWFTMFDEMLSGSESQSREPYREFQSWLDEQDLLI